MSVLDKSMIENWLLLALILFVGQDSMAQQVTDLAEIHLISDSSVSMAANSGQVFATDDDVVLFDLNTTLSTSSKPLGTLDGIGIDGYHNANANCGEAIYSLDSNASINGTAITSADVFLADGTVILNANDLGIPKGININALSRVPGTCEIVFSIDTTTTINNSVYTAADLLSWNGVDPISLYQATGIEGDIDALHILSSNRMLISLDIGTSLIGLNIHDQSVVEISQNSSLELLSFEPLIYSESWVPADLNGLAATPAFDDLIFINGFENNGF